MAKEKEVAKLTFSVNDALKNLKKVDKQLQELSKNSKTAFEGMDKNFKKVFTGSNMDTKDIEKKLKKLEEAQIEAVKAGEIQKQKELAKTEGYAERSAIKVATNQKIQAQNAANEVIKQNNKIENSYQSLGDRISKYASTYLIYQGFNELKRAITEVTQEMIDVQYQMTSIDRVLNEDGLSIDNYRDKLIQLAYDYGNSFDNVADVTLRLAQAGFNSNESLALTEKTLLALNTADLNATEATSDMIAVMSQFGLMTGNATEEAKKYGDIIDKINKVADRFPTTSADILDALKKTSSAFNLAGASIDETIAMITTAEIASQRGGKAIGTAMSNIVQQLKAEGKINILESLGIDVYKDEAKSEFNSIIDIITQMSEKMQEFKKSGKESSTEMQTLLEAFTVFRRNIGAGLLAGVAGEDSTYNQVLKTSIESVGYSLQENEKHLKTAKAAQAQFNAELLKLKTEIWDGGLEDLFRSMLLLGGDIIESIQWIVKTFGAIPTTIGAATLAFSLFNKELKVATVKDGKWEWSGIIKKIKDLTKTVQTETTALKGSTKVLTENQTGVKKSSNALITYAKNLASTTAKTIALNVASTLLNATLSLGISAAVTGVITLLDNLIHKEEKHREKVQEEIDTISDNVTELENEKDSLTDLTKQYEEIAKKDTRTSEDNQKIYELQLQINELLGGQAKGIDLVNGKYEDQLQKLRKIKLEKAQSLYEENKEKAGKEEEAIPKVKISNFKLANFAASGIDINKNADLFNFSSENAEKNLNNLKELKTLLDEASNSGKDTTEALKWVNEQIDNLEEPMKKVKAAQQDEKEALIELKKETILSNDAFGKDGITSVEEYKKALEMANEEGGDLKNEIRSAIENEFPDLNDSLKATAGTLQDASSTMKSVLENLDTLNSKFETLTKAQKEYNSAGSLTSGTLQSLIKNDLLQYLEFQGKQLVINKDAFKDLAEAQKEQAIQALKSAEANDIQKVSMGDLENVSSIAKAAIQDLTEAQKDEADKAIKAAEASDIKKVALDNVKTQANETKQEVENLATANEDGANKALGAAGAIELQKDSMQDAKDTFNNARGVLETTGNSAKSMGDKFLNSAIGITIAANALKMYNDRRNGTLTRTSRGTRGSSIFASSALSAANAASKYNSSNYSSGLSTADISKAGAAITKQYEAYINAIKKLDITSPKYSGSSSSSSRSSRSSGGSGSSRSSGSSGSSYSSRSEETEYNNRLKEFEDYVSEKERIEKRWVNKQKELGLLSNNDYKKITQERIERYQKYIQAVRAATWMNNEDRLKLEKEYTEEIEDLQLEYMGYIKDRATEEVNTLKDANEKKIDLIKKEAQARIDALNKQKDATSRNRSENDYLEKRKKILEQISYYEQRTGAEAEKGLKNSKEELASLDKDWNEQLEDWSLENKIKAIEDERDAQVKSIEEQQEAQINSINATAQAQIDAFAKSGQIVYDNAVWQSQEMANAYMNNFINPISQELANLNAKIAAEAASSKSNSNNNSNNNNSSEGQYITYKIQWGDTLSQLAKRYGTTVNKIMAANPYIKNKNKIYVGKTVQIPKFHKSGIVGGTEEAFALLKPNEVILKPEWAAGINKLAKMANQKETAPLGNTTKVEVSGDLVKINANIKDKQDANYLTKKIEKMLTDKFNINK